MRSDEPRSPYCRIIALVCEKCGAPWKAPSGTDWGQKLCPASVGDGLCDGRLVLETNNPSDQ